MGWIRRWGWVLLLLGLIWVLSTLSFSADSTSRVFIPSLRKLFPGLTGQELQQVHYLIRKLAHVCVYFVLSLILFRAFNRGRQEWHFTSSLAAMGLVLLIAFLDELHQWFVPGRGSSFKDVILDSLAAALAQILVWFRSHRRPLKNAAGAPPSQTLAGRDRGGTNG